MSPYTTPPAPTHIVERRSRAVRVLLVDEERMFTDALSRLLAAERDLEPAGVVACVAEAVACCRHEPPDVILVDLRVRDMNGADGIRALLCASPTTSVIVVTGRDEPSDVISALGAGARDYVLKTRGVDELFAIIRRQEARRSEGEARRASVQLTVRETQILEHLTNGRSTSDTAAALHISPLTVRSHVKSILTKLGVHSKVEAVSYALRSGLVDFDRSA